MEGTTNEGQVISAVTTYALAASGSDLQVVQRALPGNIVSLSSLLKMWQVQSWTEPLS